MAVLVLLALVAIPLIEIAVFIKVGGLIGLWPTLAIIIATAIAGTVLLRRQGLATLSRAQDSLRRQQFPVNEVFDGVCLLLAGALMLLPGFVTDAVGLLLFVPQLRAMLRATLWKYLRSTGRVTVEMERFGGGDVIEGEFHEVHPDRPGGKDETQRRVKNDRDGDKRSGAA